jgi:hypothetical protein
MLVLDRDFTGLAGLPAYIVHGSVLVFNKELAPNTDPCASTTPGMITLLAQAPLKRSRVMGRKSC